MERNRSDSTDSVLNGQESLQEWIDNNTGSHGDGVQLAESEVDDDLEPKIDSRSQAKENGLLNGFLQPFLALVTLKDTFLNFAYGAKLTYEPSNDSDQNDPETTDTTFNPEETKEFCSSGPCLVDSWSNCWNVSIAMDWLTTGTWTERTCEDEKRCCKQCSRNQKLNIKEGPQNQLYHKLDTAMLNGAEIIHCCCRPENTGDSWLKGSLHSRIMDINLRFATQPVYPIFVTT
jgi:hypothetical protein